MFTNFEFEKSYFLHRGLKKTTGFYNYIANLTNVMTIVVYSLSALKLQFSLNRFFTCKTAQITKVFDEKCISLILKVTIIPNKY